MMSKILKIPGAAIVLASILIGRVIGQVARGFGENPEVTLQASVYLTILAKFPNDVVSAAVMFRRMLENAKDNKNFLEELQISEEDKILWDKQLGKSERQRLADSVPTLLKLLNTTTASHSSWDSLPVIAQHSLLVRTERNLVEAITRYQSWTSEDGARRLEQANAAMTPWAALVAQFEEKHAVELQAERDAGKHLAQRIAA